jgi:hypothetical protein
MLKQVKTWHSGLSKIGKVAVWSITAVLAGTAINATASPHTNQPTNPTPKPPVSQPKITKSTITETADVEFEKTTVNDGNLEKGKTEIRTVGVNGVKTFTYEVTLENGKQTDKKLLKEEVTTTPISEVTAIGTYVAPKPACDPNYSGACVPIASDVDCAGGSGNGPAYIYGPVYVIGTDIYGLDRDGDGVGCE